MKTITLLSLLAVGTSLAGDPVYDKNPIMPPAPSLYSWFAGGTVGYLFDAEEELYTLHVGVDLPEQANGWDQALYLEVGFAEFDHTYNGQNYYSNDRAAAGGKSFRSTRLELEMVPITINYKLEKPVTQSLNAYIGAGLGIALMEAEGNFGGGRDSDDDMVLFAQAFGGLLYNVNQSFELYAGLRAIAFEDPELNIAGLNLDADDFGVETFDISFDLGARVNF